MMRSVARQAILREAQMIIVPGLPPMQETRHSRELNKRVDDVVREYRRDHPDMTEAEVHTALMKSAPGGVSPDVARRRRLAAIDVAAALVGAFTATASAGGNFNSQTWLLIYGIVAAVGGVAIALKLGNAPVPTGTLTFGSTVYCVASCVTGSSRLLGMTLPGNASPVVGSMMSTHFREPAFAWQKADERGNKPVPALSSARLPRNCASDG
jgi:hypothetical protein